MTTQLTAKAVDSAKPQQIEGTLKDKRYPDGGGLYLLVTAKGSKLWRYNYSFKTKKHVLALGKYPALSLKEARAKHTEAKKKIANNINPIEENRKAKQEEKTKINNSFKSVADEWVKLQRDRLSSNTLSKYENALNRDFYPIIGDKAIDEIKRKELVTIAQAIQERGALETAYRLLNLCNQIWRYALQLEKVEHNIVADISKQDVLKPFKKSNYKTITEPKRIGELLNAIDEYQGEYTTRSALKLLPHVFVRSSNLRLAEWDEFDLDNGVWTIPPEKMKTRKEHKLPLTKQAIMILKDIHPYTKDAKYVFHSPISTLKPLSDVTLSKALKRLDFGSEIVPHGFRAMFSTLAYESGKFRGEVIETLLAHQEPNKIKRAYNRAEYEAEKVELMEWWSEFLDATRTIKIP